MRIAIVGPGRLGRSLAILWRRVGQTVTLHGRDAEVAPDADVIVLCVPDRAIPQAAAALGDERRPVLHCSGSATLDVLSPLPRRGAFHPLMTFPGPEVALPELQGVPAAIDGVDDQVRAVATGLAELLGMHPLSLPGSRALYHASAVMSGNFATVLLAVAAEVLAAAGVPAHEAPGLLLPLTLQSLRNAAGNPAAALTGPIARGDDAVLDLHRDALREAGLGRLLTYYDAIASQAASLASDMEDGGTAEG